MSAAAAASAGPTDHPSGPTIGWLLGGAACLLIALIAAGVLSLSHLGTPPPGCGPESACAKVTRSVWGRVPLIGWPTAFVGAAWFGGLLVAWIVARGRLTAIAWLLAGLGGLISLLLIVVMLIEGTLCPWCLASHAGNLGFLGVALMSVESMGSPRARPVRRGTVGLAAVVLSVTAGLAVANTAVVRQQRAADEAALDAATESIIAAGRASDDEKAEAEAGAGAGAGAGTGDRSAASGEAARPDDGGVARSGGPTAVADDGTEAGATTDGAGGADGGAEAAPPFTGRWRLGPERAPIRFVVFMDYQCPDCRTVETELARLVAARDDVSLSVKHFPFNPPCNRLARALDFNPHPNACWAARAAEAAGALGGNEGFWRMHEALFARQGSFTDEELPELARSAGLDPEALRRTMMGTPALDRVEADVEEGIALGLVSTPTLFVNGVELGGWRASGALERAIERLAEEDLPVLSAAEAGDRPPTAARKYIDAWQGSRRIPASALDRSGSGVAVFGGGAAGSDGAATVVVFGDLSDRQTRVVDARVRTRAERDPRVRYVFRHLPLDRDCNPQAVADRDSGGCLAARLAIAAGRLGGPDAARAAHLTLLRQPAPIDGSAIAAVATATGLPPADLGAALVDPATDAALAEDVADAAVVRTGGRTVTVIVSGRIPARLEYDAIDVLQRVIDRAADEG